MRVFPAGLLLVALAAQPAMTADAPKPSSEPPPGSSVEMPYLIAPLNDGDTLVAYAFISTKIIASSPSMAIDIRDRLAFIQDAFVRDVNTTSIAKADNPQVVDTAALTTRLLGDAKKVLKPGTVSGVKLIDIQIRVLHPTAANPGGPS